MKIYDGPLGISVMSGDAKTAYRRWLHQMDRCNNPKNPGYRHYGGIGIRVEYTSRQFVGWFLESLVEFRKIHPFENPDIGRIDHNKNYSFDNIKMETDAENTKERNIRCGNHFGAEEKAVISTNLITGRKRVFKSFHECALFTGSCRKTINKLCSGKSRNTRRSVFNFQFFEIQ